VRLTLAYWVFFLISGAAMLAVTVVLWQGSSHASTVRATGHGESTAPGVPPGTHPGSITTSQHSSDLHRLLVASGAALGVMAIPAIAVGWLIAGRYLRPVRTITTTARDISATNLHQRLNLAGPDDELKELGDTFDNLLSRLERSFQSERRFVANASHELRTPLATMRASLDVALAKPAPLPAQTIALTERLRPELDHIEQLLNSLLTLARTQQPPHTEQTTISISNLVATSVERRSAAIAQNDLNITQQHDGPEPWVNGSQTLLARMVDNLIDNAVKHNQPQGWIRIHTTTDTNHVRLIIDNGGPVLAQTDVDELTRPFRRLGTERTGSDKGSGLGLSIVDAIAEAHHGTVQLHARPDGGLQVTVTLPLALTPIAEAAT
jgi:signal transduction histidine kinase